MSKKFSLTKTTKEYFGTILFQIKAEMSFDNVTKGELGGYIEKEDNLSQEDNAWVSGNARVSGNAEVSGNAWVFGNAEVSGNAWVSGNAMVSGNAEVSGNAMVSGNAEVSGDAMVSGKLKLLAGFFFGYRYKKEEIKYVKVDDDVELIYKGEAKFGEEDGNKTELLKKADELIAKAEKLKKEAKNL